MLLAKVMRNHRAGELLLRDLGRYIAALFRTTMSLVGIWQGAFSFVRFVVTLAILIVFGFGYTIVVDPTIGQAVAPIIVISVLVGFLVVSPFLLWRRAQTEIASLRQAEQATLELDYESKSPYIDIVKKDGRKVGRYHRVRVRNPSTSRTLRNVQVNIKKLVGPENPHIYPNAPLSALGSEPVFDLNPETEQYVEVFFSREDLQFPSYKILYADKTLREGSTLELIGQIYDLREICIQAQGEDTPGVNRWFKIGATHGKKLTVDLVDTPNAN